MQPAGFQILLEQGPCLVVAKPGGLLTQAPPQIDSLELRIKAFIKVRDEKPGKVYLGVPHRLDRPVSGAMVFARHVRAARRLCEQFESRRVRKVYWALVEGCPQVASDEWRDHIRKIPDQARAELVPEDHPEGRVAILRYRERGRCGRLAWLEIELETGRTHQIRVQCAARGLPIIGDALYGGTLPFGPETTDPRAQWIGLHARRIAFDHPMSHEPLDVTAPLPDHWRAPRLRALDLPDEAPTPEH